MNLGEFFSEIRNPETRGKALRTLAVAMGVASLSLSGTMVGTQTAAGLYQVVMARVQFPLIVAEVESMRQDVSEAPCETNGMLRANVAELNKRIEREHESNRHWFSDWTSSDRWNEVKRIEWKGCH